MMSAFFSGNKGKNGILIQFVIILTSIECLKIILINIIVSLLISTKLTNSGPLKMTILKRGYEVIIPNYDILTQFHHVTQTVL